MVDVQAAERRTLLARTCRLRQEAEDGAAAAAEGGMDVVRVSAAGGLGWFAAPPEIERGALTGPAWRVFRSMRLWNCTWSGGPGRFNHPLISYQPITQPRWWSRSGLPVIEHAHARNLARLEVLEGAGNGCFGG